MASIKARVVIWIDVLCATLLRSGGCLHIFFWVTHLELGANSSYKVPLPPRSISASSSTITMPFKFKCTNLTQIEFVSRKCQYKRDIFWTNWPTPCFHISIVFVEIDSLSWPVIFISRPSTFVQFHVFVVVYLIPRLNAIVSFNLV